MALVGTSRHPAASPLAAERPPSVRPSRGGTSFRLARSLGRSFGNGSGLELTWACRARPIFGPGAVASSSRGATSFRLTWWLGLSFGTGSGWELVWPSYWQVRLSLAWACSARPVFGPAGVVAWPSRGATSFRLARFLPLTRWVPPSLATGLRGRAHCGRAGGSFPLGCIGWGGVRSSWAGCGVACVGSSSRACA